MNCLLYCMSVIFDEPYENFAHLPPIVNSVKLEAIKRDSLFCDFVLYPTTDDFECENKTEEIIKLIENKKAIFFGKINGIDHAIAYKDYKYYCLVKGISEKITLDSLNVVGILWERIL